MISGGADSAPESVWIQPGSTVQPALECLILSFRTPFRAQRKVLLPHTRPQRCAWMTVITLLLLTLFVGCVVTDQRDRSKDRAPQTAVPVGLEHLDWMSGTWRREQGDEITEEIWSVPEGDTMLGMNRSVIGGRIDFYMYLRIQMVEDLGAVYFVSLMGESQLAYPVVRVGRQEVVFEDVDHDFRIFYRRVGDTLIGGMEDVEAGQTQAEWSLQLVRPD